MYESRRDESGATLILALIFVIVTGLVGVALASLTSTNLMAASSFQTKRGAEFTADAGIDAAIQLVRYAPATQTNFGTGPTSARACATGTLPLTMNNITVWVSCYIPVPPASVATPPAGGRVVEFVACGAQQAPCNSSTVDVQAQVVFDDNSDNGGSQLGTSVTIVSWNVLA